MLRTRTTTPPPSQLMSLSSSVLKSPMATANADYTPLRRQSSQFSHPNHNILTEELARFPTGSPTGSQTRHYHKSNHERESSSSSSPPPSGKLSSMAGKKRNIDEVGRDGRGERQGTPPEIHDEAPQDDAARTTRAYRRMADVDAVGGAVDILDGKVRNPVNEPCESLA